MNIAFHTRARSRRDRKDQGGYAILLILFLATLMLLATMTVAPNILTQGRRERESEMIWRGKQYVRGIKAYYRKTGKFPTSLDDLVKPGIGNVRFMRRAYKDPMNPKDGEWRLIYVGPAGQLIGSLKPQRTLQLGAGLFPGGAGSSLSGAPGQPSAGQPFGQSFGQALGQAANQITGNAGGTAPSSTPSAQNPQGNSVSADTSQPGGTGSTQTSDSDAANEALLASDPPAAIGGNIVGVGSKINQRSVIVYDKAKNYRQFEFIWDPAKDALTIGGAIGPQTGTIPGTQPGQSTQQPGSPFGTGPGGAGNLPSPNAPVQPTPLPPDTTPNPPQQP